jgi:hypothetical protein
MKIRYLAIPLLLLPLLFACKAGEGTTFVSPVQSTAIEATATASPEPPTTQATATAAAVPKPQAGKATIVGRVIVRTSKEPVASVAVRLAQVYREEGGDDGAFALDDAFSPGGVTDPEGHFRIENVEANEYVIVVGDVRTQYEIIPDSSGKPRVWDLEADQILDTGDIAVDLKM